MKPTTISEQMLFNTVRLETLDGSSGTGFFFSFKIDDINYPVLITNKHVVNNNTQETVKFHLHLKKDDGASDESSQIEFNSRWFFHPTKDICFSFVNPLFQEVRKQTGREVFYTTIDENLIYSKQQLENLSALESVVMVGYPNGLWDARHNFPIFRHGYTAAHPAFDFNTDGIGMVDMACFPGSSGSPIYILNENGYSDKKGNVYLNRSRVIFLGVLFAGPTTDISGRIIVRDIPTKQQVIPQVRTMLNLGYYVKSYELEEFKEIIKSAASLK